MATMEQCALGARVRRKDGQHGDATIVGRIVAGRVEGRVRRTSNLEAAGRADGHVVEVHYDQAWQDEHGREQSSESLDADMLDVIRPANPA